MFVYGLFGIALHARIDGGIDFQAIGIEVIAASVLLLILGTPSVKRVGFPSQGVFVVFLHLPSAIFALVRFLGSQYIAQIFTEIRCGTFLVVYLAVFQFQRFFLQRIGFGRSKMPCPLHLSDYHITTITGTFIESSGVKTGRILTHSHQGSGFYDTQILRFFREISIGRHLDTYRIVQEIELVEIHGQDFFLGEIAFELYGYHPLDGFLHHTFEYASSLFSIELFGQLLGDGTAPTGTGLHQHPTLDDGTQQGTSINARVFVETLVFGSNQGIDNIGRKVIIAHIQAVFLTQRIGAQRYPIVRNNLCGKFQVRVFQFFNGWHIAYPTFRNGVEYARCAQ